MRTHRTLKVTTLTSLFFILFIGNSNLSGEVLSPPPVTSLNTNESVGFFPSIVSWVYLNHYIPKYSDPYHNWKFELGSFFIFYNQGITIANKRSTIGIGGIGRSLIRTRFAEREGQWFFWPYLMVNDLKLITFLNTRYFTLQPYFRHDCKHDLDSSNVRLIIHDIIGLEINSYSPKIPWFSIKPHALLSKISSSVSLQLMFEYVLKPVFQNYPTEVDDITLAALLQTDIINIPGLITVFVDGRFTGILRNISITTGSKGWDIDWLFRFGIRFPSPTKGLSLYIEREHLTDDWASQRAFGYNGATPGAVDLFCFGIAIRGE